MRDTIDMAREADIIYFTNGRWWMDAGEPADELKAFEALVRADEREAVIKHLIELKVLSADGTLIDAIRTRGNI